MRRYSPGRRQPPNPNDRAARRRRMFGEGYSPRRDVLKVSYTLLKCSRVKGALMDLAGRFPSEGGGLNVRE